MWWHFKRTSKATYRPYVILSELLKHPCLTLFEQRRPKYDLVLVGLWFIGVQGFAICHGGVCETPKIPHYGITVAQKRSPLKPLFEFSRKFMFMIPCHAVISCTSGNTTSTQLVITKELVLFYSGISSPQRSAVYIIFNSLLSKNSWLHWPWGYLTTLEIKNLTRRQHKISG